MNIYSLAKERCKEHRIKILEMSQKVQALHVGGAFSSVEIVDCIYNMLKKRNDKFILSKGHAGIIQYVILYNLGILSKKQLNSYCQKNGFLGVHPDYGKPGIVASTGSLGHGLGIASGIALANRNKNNYFVVMSDGELQEGSIWEAALIIGALKLNNIIVVIDNNDLQSSTRATKTHPNLYPIGSKFRDFGWNVANCNGSSTEQIYLAIKNRKKDKPFALIAKTVKGYPISFMKDVPMWHYRSPNNEEYELALKEIRSS